MAVERAWQGVISDYNLLLQTLIQLDSDITAGAVSDGLENLNVVAQQLVTMSDVYWRRGVKGERSPSRVQWRDRNYPNLLALRERGNEIFRDRNLAFGMEVPINHIRALKGKGEDRAAN